MYSLHFCTEDCYSSDCLILKMLGWGIAAWRRDSDSFCYLWRNNLKCITKWHGRYESSRKWNRVSPSAEKNTCRTLRWPKNCSIDQHGTDSCSPSSLEAQKFVIILEYIVSLRQASKTQTFFPNKRKGDGSMGKELVTQDWGPEFEWPELHEARQK